MYICGHKFLFQLFDISCYYGRFDFSQKQCVLIERKNHMNRYAVELLIFFEYKISLLLLFLISLCRIYRFSPN